MFAESLTKRRTDGSALNGSAAMPERSALEAKHSFEGRKLVFVAWTVATVQKSAPNPRFTPPVG